MKDARELAGHLTALLFASDGPLPVEAAARALEVERRVLEAAVKELQVSPPPGLLLQRNNGHIQMGTSPGSSRYVERLLGAADPARLSRAALETLAVVCYRQPVTRAEIESVRGVNSDHALATLVSRGLVEESGRRASIGRPAEFRTTLECLQYLGLRSLEELPPLSEPDPTGRDQLPSFEIAR